MSRVFECLSFVVLLQLLVCGAYCASMTLSDTYLGSNSQTATINDVFWETARPGITVAVNFSRMADIEHTLAKQGVRSPTSLTAPEMEQWKNLVTGMQLSYFADLCAEGFSMVHGMWYVCCPLRNGKTGKTVGFCGYNINLSLPIPCRRPVGSFDYNKRFNTTSSQELEISGNIFNVGTWTCDTPLVSSKSEPVNSLSFVSRQGESVPVYSIDLSRSMQETGTCSEHNLQYLCFAFCCDSEYTDSFFCREQEFICY